MSETFITICIGGPYDRHMLETEVDAPPIISLSTVDGMAIEEGDEYLGGDLAETRYVLLRYAKSDGEEFKLHTVWCHESLEDESIPDLAKDYGLGESDSEYTVPLEVMPRGLFNYGPLLLSYN